MYENRDYFYMEIPKAIEYDDWLEIIKGAVKPLALAMGI